MAEGTRRFGALTEKLAFQRRGTAADGMGGTIAGAGEWSTQFEASAAMRPLRGGEATIAARLEGVQPYGVTVRFLKAMKQVTTAWRVVDVRDATRVFNIASPLADPDGKNKWLEFVVTQGVAE